MKVTFEGTWEEIKREMLSLTDSPAPAPAPAPAEVPAPPTEEQLPPIETEVELDAEGQPWNEEIHASTKTKTAKGVWKKRRNMNKTEEVPAPPAEVPAPPAEVPTPPAPVVTATIPLVMEHIAYLRNEMKIEGLDEKLNEKAKECGLNFYAEVFNPNTDQAIMDMFYAKISGAIK